MIRMQENYKGIFLCVCVEDIFIGGDDDDRN